jgi:hypothetical protein
VVRAALALGLPAERLVVIDRDPEVLAAARALGVQRAHEAEPPELRAERHGVLVVATPACGLDGGDIAAYPRETLVLSATSGGLGVDLESLRKAFLDAYAANFTIPVAAYRVSAASPSHDLVLGPDGHARRQLVRVLNCRRDPATDELHACPPNLATPLYQDRLVTTAMITAAVAQARTTSTPGVHLLDPRLQAEIRSAFERLGLGTPRAPTVRGVDPKFAREAYAAIAPPASER